LHYFLGVEVSSALADRLVLRQRKYALELLACACILKCSHVTTPMSSSEWLCSVDVDVLSSEEATEYCSIFGGLQYLTMLRPDLSFVFFLKEICPLLSTKCVGIFISLAPLICRLSSAFFVVFAILLTLVFRFILLPRL
jgi:hypothetical protein